MLKIKYNYENIYMSKLVLKFINTLIFYNLKIKMESFLHLCFFSWKKKYKTLPFFYFFLTLLKIRPLIGFYIYIIKKKRKKKIKIKPHYMRFESRWQKAIYWLALALKTNHHKYNLSISIFDEIYGVACVNKSPIFKQKIRYYQIILFFKSTKNYKW